MPTTRGSGKLQTRLAFTPLSASSPQALHVSPEAQHRAANVRCEIRDSSSKRRRLHTNVTHDISAGTRQLRGQYVASESSPPSSKSSTIQKSNGLPTPVASSQLFKEELNPVTGHVSAGEEISDESQSEVDEDEDGSILATTPRQKQNVLAKMNSTGFFHRTQSSPSQPLGSPGRLADKQRTRPRNSLFGASRVLQRNQDTQSMPPNKQQFLTDGECSEEDIKLPSQRHRKPISRVTQIESDESDESSLQDFPLAKVSNKRSITEEKHRAEMIGLSIEGAQEISSEPRNYSNRKTRSQTKARDAQDSPSPCLRPKREPQIPIEILSDLETEDSGKEFSSTRPIKANGKQPAHSPSKDEDSDEVVSPMHKRRPWRSANSSGENVTPKTRERENRDLAEDLDFLQSADVSAVRRHPMDKKEERRRNLEMMKALREQKANKAAISNTVAGGSRSDVSPASNDSDTEESSGQVEENSDVDAVNESLLYDGNEFDDYEKDFVDDEGAEVLGASDMAEIPLEFTMHAHQGVKHHFHRVVEWMVQNKLNPAFSRDDPVYKLAFTKVNDEVMGYASSKFISSVWRPDYLRVLKARPIFNEAVIQHDPNLASNCAACGRSGHPATFLITLEGKAYDKNTLENLKDDGDTDSSDGSDSESVDLNGNPLLPESHQFLVGKVCKANSERAHALLHWRYHLNSWILDWLENCGYTSADQLVERESWSVKRRTKYANKVVDEMSRGEIRNLWRDFKLQLQDARSQQTHFR